MNARPIVALAAAAVTLTVMAGATDAQTGRYVPKGAYIMMPATSECPSGFVANATLNAGRFPRGGTIPATGGDYEHEHMIAQHSHGIRDWTGEAVYANDHLGGARFTLPGPGERTVPHFHEQPASTYMSELQWTWPGDNIPPYATVRFCQAL